jgi:eukaryotic translation initiation factor 2C
MKPRCTALTLDPRMLRVPSSTVDFPSILYGGGHKEEAKSRWMIQNYQLLSRPRKTFNVLGISQGDPNQGLNKAFGQLQGFTGPPKGNFRNYDVATLRMSDSINVDPNSYDDLTTAASAALARHSEIDFAMLFLESKSPSAYAHFKNLVDRQLGLHSVCITRRCIEGKIGEKVSNIVLKMNLKATGTNHSTTGGMIEKHLPDTLVLGA